VVVGITGVSLSSSTNFTITFPSGATINTATPTCTSQFVTVVVTSCTFASPTLTINLGTVTAAPSSVNINVSNFVNPSTALDSWPSSGGFAVNYNGSGGVSLGNYKLTGFEAVPLTSGSMTYSNVANNKVGLLTAIAKFTI